MTQVKTRDGKDGYNAVQVGFGERKAKNLSKAVAGHLKGKSFSVLKEFRTDAAMKNHIGGVILFDETIRQKAKDGTPLVALIESAGSVPGIKVDQGAKPLALSPGETITEGLDGLRERFQEYHKLGARFAKWRAVIDIGKDIPSYNAIHANAQALARYAALAQENGIVPIVEPEVLMDGDHDIATCERVTSWVLESVFSQLFYAGVRPEGMVLKPNMVIAGKKCPSQNPVDEVARRTLGVLKRCVPPLLVRSVRRTSACGFSP